MAYRRAKSLDQLLNEVNKRFPKRSKVSDGWIGDAAHASRDSDHNPWVKDGSIGVVTAVDITEDAQGGFKEIADFIVQTLVRRRDRRVKYIIHEGLIWRSYDKPGIPAWTPSRYSGANGHFQHVHVSVQPSKSLYDSMASWGVLENKKEEDVSYSKWSKDDKEQFWSDFRAIFGAENTVPVVNNEDPKFANPKGKTNMIRALQGTWRNSRGTWLKVVKLEEKVDELTRLVKGLRS